MTLALLAAARCVRRLNPGQRPTGAAKTAHGTKRACDLDRELVASGSNDERLQEAAAPSQRELESWIVRLVSKAGILPW